MRPEKIMPQDRNSLRFSSLFVVPYLEDHTFCVRPFVKWVDSCAIVECAEWSSWLRGCGVIEMRRVPSTLDIRAAPRANQLPQAYRRRKQDFHKVRKKRSIGYLKNALNWKSVLTEVKIRANQSLIFRTHFPRILFLAPLTQYLQCMYVKTRTFVQDTFPHLLVVGRGATVLSHLFWVLSQSTLFFFFSWCRALIKYPCQV